MGAKSAMAGVILFILLVLPVISSESPPVVDLKPLPPCPKNEERRCQNPCPPETCLTLYAAFLCIQNQTCVNGCYCKKGFLRVGPKGPCVPRDQCNPLECVNDPNAQRGCGDRCGKTCADYKDCPKVCPKKPCKLDGCECKAGNIYDQNLALCVKPKDCTTPCKPHERYSRCLLNECVPKKCDDLGKPLACPAIAADPCPGGCICDYGYVKDKAGNCIDAKTCPCCGGDPNAQIGCGNPCGKTCADLYANKSELICPQYCESNGCDCKEGYLLNTDVKPSKCVLIKDCPKPKKCTKPHERYSNCLLGECVAKTCDDLGKPLPCPDIAPPCAGGCICEAGYVRDKNGNCIDAKTCPRCGEDPNAVTGCGNPCGRTCANLRNGPNKTSTTASSYAVACATYCEVNGCDCKKGYILNTDLNPPRCVLPEDCDKPVNKCKKNEEFYCGPSCPDSEASCANPNPPPCLNKKCELKCFCEKGFVKDANKSCIPADKCPKQCTKPHERYSNCLLGECVAKTCDDLGKPLPCPDIAPPCAGGCICKAGYVRDKNGNCIDAKTCPRCGDDPNAVTGCGNPCGRTCASLRDGPNKTACPTYCEVNGCDCKKGYILNTDLKPPRCVLPEDCDQPLNCTKPHERYINCLPGQCGPKTCDDLGRSISCPFIRGPCPGGCICEEGYLRNSEGNCIKLEECPPKPCGRNETWMSPCNAPCPYPKCPRNDQPPPPCVPILPCYPGCQCKLNHLRNYTGHCILAPDCPPVNCTRKNEKWNKCPSACLAETCDDVNQQPKTCNTLIWLCSPRCVCKKGHFRNKEGICIPASQCPATKCTKPNEKYIDCLPGQCKPKTCEELITPAPCPRVRPPCPGGCICVDGYVRNAAGDCIKEENCPTRCKGPHEKYIDCPAGQCNLKTCDDLVTSPGCPRIIPPCPGGCVCEEGYLRNSTGICIKKEECPSLQCTKPNERYSNCLIGECVPKKCDEVGHPVPCADIIGPCAGGCTCIEGFVRDSKGDCIDMKKCPTCGGDPNAVSGCGNPCGKDCASLYANKSDIVCPQYCEYNGCDCKPGYRLPSTNNTDTKKCIPEEECPKPSVCKDPNASWKVCRDACPATCQNTRPSCINKTCCPGCQCNEGYVLSKPGGKCVKIATCADYVDCGGNQTFVSCTFKCPQVMCPRSDQTLLCKPPRDCPGGCGCKPYYRYNATGDCVKSSDCPPVKCNRPNEEFKCQRISDWERCEDRYNSPPFYPGHHDDCTPKCVCKKGFWRNNENKCVPAKECPLKNE